MKYEGGSAPTDGSWTRLYNVISRVVAPGENQEAQLRDLEAAIIVPSK